MLISGKRRLPVVIKCVDFELGFGLLIAAALMAISVPSMFGQGNRPQRGQVATVQAPISQAQKVPQWQTAAGGKMSFDVASIRPSKPGTFTPPNFPLSNDDFLRTYCGPLRGRFSTDGVH
jgi:hypothetical protein